MIGIITILEKIKESYGDYPT